MSLVKYGGGIIQMSGSIAGTTHARNRFGNYIRSRTKPVNPKSDRQSAVRLTMQQLAEYWHGPNMSDVERALWASYAAAVAMKNRLGENIYLTGFNHFLRSNAARLAAGGAIIESGPTTLSLPETDPTFAVSGDSGTQLLTVAFDDTLPWDNETGGFLLIDMGTPQLATRFFFGGPYRTAGAIAGVTGVPVESPQTIPVPFAIATGQKIWAKASIVRADGRVSNKFYAPSFVVGGLLPLYSVTGTLSPDAVCNYPLGGAFNGKAFYRRADGAYFIWWDAVDTWYISTELGTVGEDYWERTDPAIVGAYTNEGGATGAATVGAGEHP